MTHGVAVGVDRKVKTYLTHFHVCLAARTRSFASNDKLNIAWIIANLIVNNDS